VNQPDCALISIKIKLTLFASNLNLNRLSEVQFKRTEQYDKKLKKFFAKSLKLVPQKSGSPTGQPPFLSYKLPKLTPKNGFFGITVANFSLVSSL
ncbi:hypothetical protein BpHYR1_016049, partial [Brachionus plicatilis]